MNKYIIAQRMIPKLGNNIKFILDTVEENPMYKVVLIDDFEYLDGYVWTILLRKKTIIERIGEYLLNKN